MNNLNNQVWEQMTLEEAVVEVEKINNEYKIKEMENEIIEFKNEIKETEKIIEEYENMLKDALDKKRIQKSIDFCKSCIEDYKLFIENRELLINIKKERMSKL